MKEVLFEGFDDPLLSVAHSGIFITVANLFGFGDQLSIIPEMRKFAYMAGVSDFRRNKRFYVIFQYNNSFDENYWINTGYKDFSKLGYVENWAGLSELPETFWPTKEARQIIGAGNHSNQIPK